jgi:hypothetical protein
MGPFGRIVRTAKDAVEWSAAIWHVLGWLGFASILSGLALSIGGAVWAVIKGVPMSLAIMAGYCTFVGAVYLMMAPAVYRLLAKAPVSAPAKKPEPPNYEAWRHVDKFLLKTAAHLWCDVDPLANDTYDTFAWAKAFESAASRGELKATGSGMPNLTITREALKEFAKRHGYDPQFLRE